MCTAETYEEVDAWCRAQTALPAERAVPALRLPPAERGGDGRRHWNGRREFPLLLSCPPTLLLSGVVGVDPAQPQLPQVAVGSAGLGFDLRTPLGKEFVRYIAHGLVPILRQHGFPADADLSGEPPDYTPTVNRLHGAIAIGRPADDIPIDDCECSFRKHTFSQLLSLCVGYPKLCVAHFFFF